MDTIDFSQFLLQNYPILIAHIIASIGILLILFWLVYKPFKKWIKKRQNFFKEQKNKSTKNLNLSNELKKKANLRIIETEETINELIFNNNQQMKINRQNILKQIEKEKQNIIIRGHEKAKQIKNEAEDEIKKSIVESSLQLTEKILKEKITKKDHQKLINDFIDNLNE